LVSKGLTHLINLLEYNNNEIVILTRELQSFVIDITVSRCQMPDIALNFLMLVSKKMSKDADSSAFLIHSAFFFHIEDRYRYTEVTPGCYGSLFLV